MNNFLHDLSKNEVVEEKARVFDLILAAFNKQGNAVVDPTGWAYEVSILLVDYEADVAQKGGKRRRNSNR